MLPVHWILVATMVTVGGPALPPGVGPADADRLRAAVADVLALDEAALRALVPTQSGFLFVGCPNCRGGRQETQLQWSLTSPDEVFCGHCRHRYPSPQYPMNQVAEHTAPDGSPVRYPYWADAQGYRYYFAARADELKKTFLERRCLGLARLAFAANEPRAARLAVVLLDRFAEVFGRWCWHYDYPFRQKEIHDGVIPPERWKTNFRTARYDWWGYLDIPTSLALAWDLVKDRPEVAALSHERGVDVARRIEQDLFRAAADPLLVYPDDYSNMSPGLWASLVTLGRVIGEPRYVREPLRRLRVMLDRQFYADGSWMEGAPSYHAQVLGSLDRLAAAAQGYSDPPDYQPPAGEPRLVDLDLARDLAALARSRAVLLRLRLPHGRALPIHDTWAKDRRPPAERSESFLLGALGHACLGRGTGAGQQAAHLTWSGAYGHEHGDGLALLLYAAGAELLPDLGYTHTAWRAWAITTLSHNTVVIDHRPQALSRQPRTDGTLRWYHPGAWAQGVAVDNPKAYPALATTYRRTVLQVPIDAATAYLLDSFEVAGGQQHDYLLWGPADGPATLTLQPAASQPVASLLPPGLRADLPTNEGDLRAATSPGLAYAFLSQIASAQPAGPTVALVSGPAAGYRATLLTAPGDTVYQVAGPSIRGAGENDQHLPEHLMPGLIWRRSGGPSRFVSVLEPFATAPRIGVTALAVPGAAAAVRVGLPDGRVDVVVWQAREAAVAEGPVRCRVTGEVAVIRVGEGRVEQALLVGPGQVTGSLELRAAAPEPVEVVEFEAQALVLAGRLAAEPGATVLVRHGDGAVSPYTVARASDLPTGGTRLELVEGTGYSMTAAREAKATGHPHWDHPGPHRAELAPVSEMLRRDG